MDKELKAKWTAALRSGAYEQGSGALKEYKRFCCIGVLGDIQGLDWRTLREPYPYTCQLPLDYRAGLTFEVSETLADMNDGNSNTPKHSFAQIADYIDANL